MLVRQNKTFRGEMCLQLNVKLVFRCVFENWACSAQSEDAAAAAAGDAEKSVLQAEEVSTSPLQCSALHRIVTFQ